MRANLGHQENFDRSVIYPLANRTVDSPGRLPFFRGIPSYAAHNLRRKFLTIFSFLKTTHRCDNKRTLSEQPFMDVDESLVVWDVDDSRAGKVCMGESLGRGQGAQRSAPRRKSGLERETDQLPIFEGIIGSSPALQALLSRVTKVAPTDSTVLITGETGTGKELVASAIHKRSRRSAHPFVSVSCAAVPSSLITSELFGHEKGAFTGAEQRRVGRFEMAEGGTIFFDEIGELSAEAQTALLRVLQERKFGRVGGSHSISTDVRVIAATNRNLQAAIAAGTFRLDLFYRLNVFPLEVPPLRERKEDIPLLLEYFTKRYASRIGKNIKLVDNRTIELFQSCHWPGNVREMENLIERSVILCEGEVFSADERWLLQQLVQPNPPLRPAAGKLLVSQKEMIEAALAESKGRVSGPSGAAAKLGIPSSTLESKIKALKIKKNRFKLD
jgi:transcriptional regulator with GAF, ATPase, and Fis domain